MPARLIDGVAIAAEVRAEVAREVGELRAAGIVPGLGVILVGDDPASHAYVGRKTEACREAGIHARDVRLPAGTSEREVLAALDDLNRDPAVHGILVQLPLPERVDASRVMRSVAPAKDVDGFHPVNVGGLASGDPRAFRPATPAAVQEMLRRIGYDPAGRHAVIVGRSNIVGRPMAAILSQNEPWANATVTLAHSRTRDLPSLTRRAEILVVAIGRPHFVTGDMVGPGAVVVDVGVNRVADPSRARGYRLVGDVEFEGAREVAAWITPVPGGVGPMTIAMLLRNTVTAARRLAEGAAGAAESAAGAI